jgi:chromosome segregation protein
MYLEKLEIQGFKSFANKNKLLFSGFVGGKKRGITVIVGPNGSGKSNIADAIRWVLGEQSTKLLRSKKNEDVIFSGSDKKSRLNMAEVSLYLNNESGPIYSRKPLPPVDNLDSSSEQELGANNEGDSVDALLLLPEIVITRRVFRDGSSEYLINNNKVRLSDVQIFLAKANFGQKTYSVIGQGMVENFLNTSPAERKSFFDEATGVKQYQIKRDLSLNKLENSQENLGKVEMLLSEIEPRLKSLTRQVSKLKKRQSLEDDLSKNQLNYYGRVWQDINFRLGELKLNISGLEKSKIEIERELETNKVKMEELNQGETLGEEFYELQKRFLFLKSEQDRAGRQLEKISLCLNAFNQLQNESDAKTISELTKERDDLNKKIEANNIELEKIKSNNNEDKLRQLETELRSLEQNNQEKYRELSKIEAWMEIKLEKQGKFDLSFLNNRLNELKKNIKDSNDKLIAGEASLQQKDSKLEGFKLTKNDLESEISNLEKELNRINIEETPGNVQKINEELKRLIKKIDDNDNLSGLDLLKKIILEIGTEIKKLLQFSSGDNYRYQLENVNNKILELKQEKNKISEKISELSLNIGLERNELKELDSNIKKWHREILEVEEKISLNQNNEDLLESQNKKIELEKELEVLGKKINELRLEFNSAKANLEDFRQNISEKQRVLQSDQFRLSNLNSQINSLKSNSIKAQSRLDDLFAEISVKPFSADFSSDFSQELLKLESQAVESFQTENAKEISILQEKVDNVNQAQETKKRNLLELQRTINEQEKSVSSINYDLNNNKISLAREETRIEDVENNINLDKLNLDKIKKHQVEENINVDRLKSEISELKSQLEMIGGIDPETEKEYEETQKRFSFLYEQTEDLNKTIKSLEKVIIELDTIIKERFEAEFKVISEKFNEYFKILFNGGNAKIFPLKENALADSEEGKKTESNAEGEQIALNKNAQSEKNIKLIKYLKKYNAIGLSGVDIIATPPGKKISSVSMLSGGERALTAIALICAIISANPSPFVVLDEVDAALDEANSGRLASILDDLSNKTQFIAISHNRSTMRKANVLYGVTMESDGVSKLLSVKLDESLK